MISRDRFSDCYISLHSFHKARRVTRLSSARETIAGADAFDKAFMFEQELQPIVGMLFSLFIFTYSKLLFDAIMGNKQAAEKRLMVDIAAVQEGYNEGIIESIGFIK